MVNNVHLPHFNINFGDLLQTVKNRWSFLDSIRHAVFYVWMGVQKKKMDFREGKNCLYIYYECVYVCGQRHKKMKSQNRKTNTTVPEVCVCARTRAYSLCVCVCVCVCVSISLIPSSLCTGTLIVAHCAYVCITCTILWVHLFRLHCARISAPYIVPGVYCT